MFELQICHLLIKGHQSHSSVAAPDVNGYILQWLAGLDIYDLDVKIHGNTGLVFRQVPANLLAANICEQLLGMNSLDMNNCNLQSGPSDTRGAIMQAPSSAKRSVALVFLLKGFLI